MGGYNIFLEYNFQWHILWFFSCILIVEKIKGVSRENNSEKEKKTKIAMTFITKI